MKTLFVLFILLAITLTIALFEIYKIRVKRTRDELESSFKEIEDCLCDHYKSVPEFIKMVEDKHVLERGDIRRLIGLYAKTGVNNLSIEDRIHLDNQISVELKKMCASVNCCDDEQLLFLVHSIRNVESNKEHTLNKNRLDVNQKVGLYNQMLQGFPQSMYARQANFNKIEFFSSVL